MMGIHILTSFDTPVSVESFLGIIGDFIDPNNDRAIDLLPVVIPILAKRDLTTFIFKTHQDAVKFCEYFKTCSRQDFFIRALGIDKLKEIPHDAVRFMYKQNGNHILFHFSLNSLILTAI